MRMRVARFSGIIVAAVVALGGTRTAGAQQTVKLGAGDKLTIGGFINATLHNNPRLVDGFGQGQKAKWASGSTLLPDRCWASGPPGLPSRPISSARSTAPHRSAMNSHNCERGSPTST